MSDQHTKVDYTAVSNFADLDNDLDKLLAKLKAIKKAEKDIGKGVRRGPREVDGTPRTGRAPSTSRSAEANERRRIARYDQAQRIQQRRELAHQRAMEAASKRRSDRALQAQKLLAAQETRAEKAKEAAQKRRNAKADQRLKEEFAAQTARFRAQERAQRRIERNSDAALDNRLRREKAANDSYIKSEVHALGQRLKDENAAAEIRRREDMAHSKRVEAAKNEAQRERLRQERLAAREVEARDKIRADELRRELLQARAGLDRINSEAQDGNRFTRNKIQPRSVGQVKVDFNPERDANYYEAVARAREEEIRLVQRSTQAVEREMEARGRLYNILRRIPAAAREAGNSTSGSFRNTQRDIRNTTGLLANFRRNLDAIGRWRPRLLPPFIALIPIIGALLGLMNPLAAGLGAVGAAAIGLAGSLGSLAGAALGAIPALASLLSVGAALKMTFGGVGKALKAAGKSTAPSGGGGGSTGGSSKPKKTVQEPILEELTQVERIQRAQEMYRRSIEDVADASRELAEAKKEYLDRLKEVERQVNRVRTAEARAAANAQLAQENYWNVMADSSSTKGQKMDALVGMDEAREELEDTKKQSQDLRSELAELKRTGMNGDPAVRRATRALTDAIWAQRDAQIDLANAYKDTGRAADDAADASSSAADAASEAAGGTDEFAEAMAKLSPSAQAVVLALLAMQPAWEAVRKTVQERFFSEIVEDIQLLVRLFPVLENLLGNTAGALGRVASRGLRLVTSDKWLRDLNILAEQNVPLIENVGDGLLEILDALLDLSVAAGPFAIAMSESFKEGAKNFGDLVANARETGSLASWLETVQTRLSQWWRIIKNIGVTLFNYTAAASDFGTWLTDGFERMTEGWRAASEEARAEGSPFKAYLEDIKPALSAVKDMFASFFSWFGREASNPENIAAFTRIIETITDELGPALARIFDAMSQTGVGESLLDAIVQIVETLADFLEKGGAEGIKQFFETINWLFGTLEEFVSKTDPEVIKGIAAALMTISALRFFGLTKLIDKLIVFAGSKGLGKLKDLFKNISKSNNVKSPVDFGTAAGGATSSSKGGGFWANLGKGVKTGGPIGLAAGALVGMGLDAFPMFQNTFNGTYANNPKQGSKDTLRNSMKWSMPGIGLGLDVIGIFFPNAEQKINKFLDDTSSNIVNWVYDLPNKVKRLGVDMWFGLGDFLGWLQEQWDNAISWIQGLPEDIATEAGKIWGNLQNLGDWFSEQWDNALEWLKDTPNRIATDIGVLWGNLQNFNEWLEEKWIDAGIWLAELPGRIATSIGVLWGNVQDFNQWLEEKWSDAADWLKELPAKIGEAAEGLWSQLQTFVGWLNLQWIGIGIWFAMLPTRIGILAAEMWSNLPTLAVWLADRTAEIKKWAEDLPVEIGKYFAGLAGSFKKGEQSVRPEGLAKGGGRGPAVMSAAPKRRNSGSSSESVWSIMFGDPVAWLNEKWVGVTSWFKEKTTEMLAPIQTVGTIVSIAWTLLWAGITSVLQTAYEKYIQPIFTGIGNLFRTLGILLTIVYVTLIKPTLDNVGRAFEFLKAKYVDPVMRGISNTIRNIVLFGIIPVLATMASIVRTKPGEAFEEARDRITRAWSAIKGLTKEPVRFVVDVVIGSLVDAVNSIPGVHVRRPQLPPGFHDGGHTGNRPWREAVGVVHGDEHVIRAQSRQKIERNHPGMLDYMNTYGEVPGYKKGGLVNPLPPGSYSVSQPYRGAAHNGIDLAAPTGTRVYATGEGTVMLAGVVPMGGNEVYIQHDNGLGTRYSHLSRFASRPGQRVRPGNVIGYVGSTGMSTGPHLHYMVHNPGRGPGFYGNHQDPAGWMNGNAQDLGEAWNPLTGLVDLVTSKINDRFPAGGWWVDVAAGIAKQTAKQIVTAYTPKIGSDSGHTLFDNGGWWNGDQKPVSKLSKPEAILTTPQWESMHNISNLMTRAFSNLNTAKPRTADLGVTGLIPNSSVTTGASVDNRIIIEKMEVNNPVGETSDTSLANTVRDMTYLRGR